MDTTSLGDRMKEYENAYRFYLPRRLPIIVRIDGRAFHTYTRSFTKPFDNTLHYAMVETAKELCHAVEGCKFSFTQSDEISLVVTNDDNRNTSPWFDNNLQKITSIAAATASVAFHEAMRYAVTELNEYDSNIEYREAYHRYLGDNLRHVVFDARAFVLPEYEVNNYFIWRQRDMIRNSIEMVGRAHFSHNELIGKNTKDMCEMLAAKGIYWGDCEDWQKYGTGIIKRKVKKFIAYNDKVVDTWRSVWDEWDKTILFDKDKEWLNELVWRNRNNG